MGWNHGNWHGYGTSAWKQGVGRWRDSDWHDHHWHTRHTTRLSRQVESQSDEEDKSGSVGALRSQKKEVQQLHHNASDRAIREMLFVKIQEVTNELHKCDDGKSLAMRLEAAERHAAKLHERVHRNQAYVQRAQMSLQTATDMNAALHDVSVLKAELLQELQQAKVPDVHMEVEVPVLPQMAQTMVAAVCETAAGCKKVLKTPPRCGKDKDKYKDKNKHHQATGVCDQTVHAVMGVTF